MNLIAHFALVAARAGQAAVSDVENASPSRVKPTHGRKTKGATCTPCAAQARKDAAVGMVRGVRGT